MELNKKLNQVASKFLSAAILKLYPQAQYAGDELIDNGFRSVFKFPEGEKLSINDFGKIKKAIEKILSNPQAIKFENMNSKSLLEIYKGNKFYTTYIEGCGKNSFPVIKIDDFVSECEHIDKLPNAKYITLHSIGGFYWQGDANSDLLVAVDGWAVSNEDEFKQYEAILQDREERDHRRIGANLELFTFDPLIGQGLPIWLESGFATKFEIEKYTYELLRRNGYHFIETPILGTTDLYKTSGHWDHYRENMFSPFKVDNEEFVLKPMNCPHEIMVYKQKPHSYRELPYRIAEFGIQHRYESSGSLTGLERVRYMKLVDTHEVLMHSQIKKEIKHIYEIILEAHKTLGTSIYSVDLSLHDPKDTKKFFDNPKMWRNAEDGLRGALKALKVPYREMIGEAAFYGPKIDLQIKTALGHVVTVSTIQLDFLLPERFDMSYINEKGEKQRPVFIPAGIIGTFERYMAILLEQTKGVLPLWLSPIQVQFIPVNNEVHGKYAAKLQQKLVKLGFRAKIDDTDNRVGYKIRNAQTKKVPYQIVIGDEEVKSKDKTITYRQYGKTEEIKVPFSKFVSMIKKQIKEHK